MKNYKNAASQNVYKILFINQFIKRGGGKVQ